MKLAVYAVLEAEDAGQFSLRDHPEPDFGDISVRRMTIRLPLLAHDALTASMTPMGAAGALSKIARLYASNLESLKHV